MGKRSSNTTKGGRFMNPTDRARKEARKKELKKNKSKRQMVRTNVLKETDAKQLLCELEKIDKMEFDVNQPPQLNENVLKEKRRKLQENFRRVVRFYEKEDPPQFSELRRLEGEYNRRRIELMQYFQSVKHAEQVQVNDIPMPDMPFPDCSRIPLPQPSVISIPTPLPVTQPLAILKKPFLYRHNAPGVPPGPPPVLSDSEDEIEETETKIETKSDSVSLVSAWGRGATSIITRGPPGRPPGPPPGLPPRISGPPPVLLPHISGPPVRLPPALPPPPPPTSLMFLPDVQKPQPKVVSAPPNLISAPPNLIINPKPEKKMVVTINAKPKIKNLMADATRFMPTALRIKREEKKPTKSMAAIGPQRDPLSMNLGGASRKQPLALKEDAYAKFMKEMTTLL